MRLELNGTWKGRCLTFRGEEAFTFEGTVPGCVHTDLMGSFLPADLYWRDNADASQWIEERNWEYTKVFTLEQVPEAASLVFEGLDTYATITLNGTPLGSTDNMFIRHSFPVTQALRKGENTLTVFFRSPVQAVAHLEERKGSFTRERLHTRRVQCTYGWDWVARFVTCGIWRDVYLDTARGFRVKDAYVYTESLMGSAAQLVVEAELLDHQAGGHVTLTVRDPEGNTVYSHRRYCREPRFRQYITLPNARLWYPLGYGDQPMYTLELGELTVPFGVRTAVIEELPDAPGTPYYEKCLQIKDSPSGKIYDENQQFSGFRLLINGLPILCKGANWVPAEPFPSAVTPEKITRLLELAKEAGVNMLRVWGGGIFEDPHFYNECDRLGILVTQDFLMACGHYPEDQADFIAQLQKEAEFAAYALRNHPSLVWWSGDNENAVRGTDELEDYRGRTANYRGIEPVLSRLDPKRRLLASSPYGGSFYASKTVGTTHNTQYMGCSIFPYILNTDMADYKEHFATYLARFIAEEPTTGAICLPSLRRFMTEEDIFKTTQMWQYHTKSNPALSFTLFDVLQTFAQKVLGEYTDGADRLFKLQYNQYEWIRISMENIRRNRGFINGIIYWMWNDCWPAASGWSFVDYYGLPKASFYSFKRCAGEVLTSIVKNGDYDIYLCNDGPEPREVTLDLCSLDEGLVTFLETVTVTAPAASAQKVCTLTADYIPQGAAVICDAAWEGGHDRSFYREGKLPIVPCQAPAIIARTENSLTLEAAYYIHATQLEGEYVFSDNYFSMLPGQQHTVTFRPAPGAQAPDLTVKAYTLADTPLP